MVNRFKKLIWKNQRRAHSSQFYWLLSVVVFALVLTSCKTEISENSLADIHGPGVVSTNPSANSIDFPIADSISVTFIENIKNSLDSQQSFTLLDGSNQIQGNVVITDQILSFTPASPLEKTTTYTATIDGEIKDTSGNRMAHDYTWSFESTRHPTISSAIPADGKQDVAINSSITATFSEVMDSDSINTTTFTLSDGTSDITGSVSYSNLTAAFFPNGNLSEWTDYTGNITTGVKDLAGNAMLANYSWSFKSDDTTAPEVASVSPADNATAVALDTSISVTFSETINPTTVTTNTTNTSCSGSLQLSADNFSTCIQMSGDPASSSGNTVFTVTPASDLDDDTTYALKITTSITDISNYNSLVSETISQFTTVDLTPPQIASVSPTDSATKVSANTVVTAVFDEAINSATITIGTFTLANSTNGISGIVSYTGLTATFTPDSNLDVSTDYIATITTGVEDLAGNALSVDMSWTFTTSLLLPDTGQTTSYTSTFGEDSDYSINPPSYTDNDDGTVTDNNTLLIWQQLDDNTTRTWSNASTYCNNLTLGGNSNWRLPTPKELQSLVNYDVVSPSINTTYFTGTNSLYWSSFTSIAITSLAWYVDFDKGNVNDYNKSYSFYVRCVRAGSDLDIWSFDFLDNGDNTVTHRPTGLIWQQQDDNTTRTWESALSYCEGLSLAGYLDWRLPNARELQTLVDYSKYNPAIDTALFPNTNSSFYWSSTTDASDADDAWFLGFYNGIVDSSYNKSNSYYVRCVRAGQ